MLGDSIKDDNGDFTIRIDPSIRFSKTLSRLTLIHEMAHCHIWETEIVAHGKAFNNELDRLYKAGAFRHLL